MIELKKGDYVKCINVGAYTELIYGKIYEVIDVDTKQDLIKIKKENGVYNYEFMWKFEYDFHSNRNKTILDILE